MIAGFSKNYFVCGWQRIGGGKENNHKKYPENSSHGFYKSQESWKPELVRRATQSKCFANRSIIKKTEPRGLNHETQSDYKTNYRNQYSNILLECFVIWSETLETLESEARTKNIDGTQLGWNTYQKCHSKDTHFRWKTKWRLEQQLWVIK